MHAFRPEASRAARAPSEARSRRPGSGCAAVAALLVACSGGSGSSPPPGGGPDTTAPTVPAGVAARAVSAARIDVTWLASTDDVGVSGYRVRRGGAVVGTASAPGFSEQGLAAATVHCYTVSAYDEAGNESAPSASACATTPADVAAPTTPPNVVVQPVSATRIVVTWDASSDDTGVTAYDVRRDGAVVGTQAARSFTDQGLSPATPYCYTVSARDAAGHESAPSAPACQSTFDDTTAPLAPGGVLATAVSPARVALAWTAPSDDVAVTGYRIRRDGAEVATTTSVAWEDPTRSPQTAYCYAVSAYDAAGNESAPSEAACATTPRRPVAATGGAGAPLTLTDGGDGTVTDGVTGLVWQQATLGPSNWYEANGTLDAALNPSGVDVCGALELGGRTGWRLPTDAELLDIADYSLVTPLDPGYFTLVPPPNDFYWSSTPLEAGTARIWFQGVGWLGPGSRSTEYAVRCVLGGPGLGPSLTAPGDGTVFDASTGLTWEQGFQPDVSVHDGPGGATEYCAALALAGGGWRLPTVKEAKSLAPIDLATFPGTAAEPFWTSTRVLAGGWWCVEPVGGTVSVNAGAPAWTRCVRGP